MTIGGVAVPGTDPNAVTPAPDGPSAAGAEPTAAAGRPRYRKLYRTPHGRMLGGVAHGLAVHLGLPVTWVRAAFVLLFFANGIGALLYAAFWFVVPIGIGEPARSGSLGVSYVWANGAFVPAGASGVTPSRCSRAAGAGSADCATCSSAPSRASPRRPRSPPERSPRSPREPSVGRTSGSWPRC